MIASAYTYQEAIGQADHAETLVQLGHLFKTMGNREAALTEYRHALAIDPHAPAARHELAEMGDRVQQQRRFDTQVIGGGVEALLTLSHTIAAMRSDLDRISWMLPEALACRL